VEFDLLVLAENHSTQSALWSLARAEALAASVPLLDRAVALSARHGVEVCRALGDGVLEALQAVMAALAPRARRTFPSSVLFEHSLTVLYRILFLLFAEARGLVPLWHPIYRDRYSLDAIVGALLQGQSPRGLWRALQAIAHLAHSGCSAGELSVATKARRRRILTARGPASPPRSILCDLSQRSCEGGWVEPGYDGSRPD